jgi:hypothetical protein
VGGRSVRGEVRGRLEGFETRLALKADNWTVTRWGRTLAGLIAVAAGVATAVVVHDR